MSAELKKIPANYPIFTDIIPYDLMVIAVITKRLVNVTSSYAVFGV